MLKLDDLIEHVLVDSGQFICDMETTTLIDRNRFKRMALKELDWFNKYRPNKEVRGFRLYNAKVFQLENDGVIPEVISEIKYRQAGLFIDAGRKFGIVSSYYWRYDQPVLYFNGSDDVYEVTFTSQHLYDEENECFPTLDARSHRFLDLVTGRFMMSVGRSRRAFTLGDLPIQNDASELVSEGKEIYDEAKLSCQANSRFYVFP